ncbi:MAG: hypothetical protein U0074_01680 [Kouleothrix sp.]
MPIVVVKEHRSMINLRVMMMMQPIARMRNAGMISPTAGISQP